MKLSSSISIQRRQAFTILEILMVVIIITILATLAMPGIKGLTKTNGLSAASRQLLDDLAAARQKAINNRSKVYMVFVPPNFWNFRDPATPVWSINPSISNALQLSLGQYTTYALFSDRSLGDQPGQGNPRYLTRWKTLPEGIIVETNMFRAFIPGSTIAEPEIIVEPTLTPTQRTFRVWSFTNDLSFPFPHTETTNTTISKFFLPYIAFDSNGRLASGPAGQDFFIPITRASIFPARDANLKPTLNPADVVEAGYRETTSTNYTLIHIDWMTGRARVERPLPQ